MAGSGTSAGWWAVLAGSRPVARAALFVFILALLSGVWEAPFIPWARSFGLWPTLTGRWVGKGTLPDGRTSFVYLDLNGRMPGRSGGGSTIGGQAQWCEQGGPIQEYVVYGRHDNWRGTRFHLATSSRTEQTRMLSNLHGEWQGDNMHAAGRIVSYMRSVSVSEGTASTPTAQELRYTLHRGTIAEFTQACERRDR